MASCINWVIRHEIGNKQAFFSLNTSSLKQISFKLINKKAKILSLLQTIEEKHKAFFKISGKQQLQSILNILLECDCLFDEISTLRGCSHTAFGFPQCSCFSNGSSFLLWRLSNFLICPLVWSVSLQSQGKRISIS